MGSVESDGWTKDLGTLPLMIDLMAHIFFEGIPPDFRLGKNDWLSDSPLVLLNLEWDVTSEPVGPVTGLILLSITMSYLQPV